MLNAQKGPSLCALGASSTRAVKRERKGWGFAICSFVGFGSPEKRGEIPTLS